MRIRSEQILTESCAGSAAAEAMFLDGILTAICATLTNLKPDLLV
jgi:hypothetical protein